MVFLFLALKTCGQQLYSSWNVLLPPWVDIDLLHNLFNLIFTTGKPRPLLLSLLLGGLVGSLVLPLRRTWPVRLSRCLSIMALMLLARAISRTAGLVTWSSHLIPFFSWLIEAGGSFNGPGLSFYNWATWILLSISFLEVHSVERRLLTGKGIYLFQRDVWGSDAQIWRVVLGTGLCQHFINCLLVVISLAICCENKCTGAASALFLVHGRMKLYSFCYCKKCISYIRYSDETSKLLWDMITT